MWHRSGAPWLLRLTDELLSFPAGTYKDQVDVLAYAGLLATQDAYLRAAQEQPLLVWPPAPESEQEAAADPYAAIRGDAQPTSPRPSSLDYLLHYGSNYRSADERHEDDMARLIRETAADDDRMGSWWDQ